MTDAYKPEAGAAEKNTLSIADVADQAKSMGTDLKAKAADLTNTVTRSVQEQVAEMGTTAKAMAADATGRVNSAMNEQKNASAKYLGTVAQAVERAAGEFDVDMPQAARYIRQAAGQIETVANAVRQRDMRELVGEVQEFARRQPTLFFGGAVVLGFAALRFLKSSAPTSKPPEPHTSGGSYSGPTVADISQPRS